MQTKTLQVAIAVVVFFGLNLLFFGATDGRLYLAVASSLIFGLTYAAILAGIAIFHGDKAE